MPVLSRSLNLYDRAGSPLRVCGAGTQLCTPPLLCVSASGKSLHADAGTPKDAVNRMFDPSTFRKVFGGNDCLQQPDTLITKCRGSKDHEYWCACV